MRCTFVRIQVNSEAKLKLLNRKMSDIAKLMCLPVYKELVGCCTSGCGYSGAAAVAVVILVLELRALH